MRFITPFLAITIGLFWGIAGSASAGEPVLLSVSSSQNPVSVGKTIDVTATLRSIWRAPFGELQFEGLGQTSYDALIYTAPDEFSITAGFSHSCALTYNGTAQCWGDNTTYGQLGNGTSVSATTPYAVSGLGAENRAIVAGSVSTCVLTSAGGVKCWGSNTYGELGQGTGAGGIERVPVNVSGLASGVRQIAGGGSHFCAVKTDDSLVCWGRNNHGQLGTGSLDNSDEPVAVSGLPSGVNQVALGDNHSCALLWTGDIYCWGRANSGQLGHGSTPLRSTSPVEVVATTIGSASELSAGGNTTCAIGSNDASAYCWGAGADGQVGDNGFVNRNAPSKVATTKTFEKLAVGSAHVCALEATGGVACWGDGSAMQLGRNGATNDEPSPEEVFDLRIGVTAIAAGGQHSCALLFSGATMCWGEGGSGQLGGQDFNDAGDPQVTYTVENHTVQVEMGGASACSLSHTGQVSCWGYNAEGELGDGSTASSNTPVLLNGLTKPIYRLARFHSTPCAIGYDGDIRCWGYGTSGQVGNGDTQNQTTPQPVSGFLTDGRAVAGGFLHSCALDTAGKAYCWGTQSLGQLGNGITTNASSASPVAVTGASFSYETLVASNNTTCAASSDDGVECWGSNASGALGAGLSDASNATPQKVSGLVGGVLDIAAGFGHFCVIDGDRSVKCWGSNDYSVLGQPATVASSNVPVTVSGLPAQAVKLGLGSTHSCALLVDGRVYCWGANSSSVMGTAGSSTGDPTPVEVPALGSGALSITSKSSSTCIIISGEGIKCIGNGASGQLGHGKNEGSATAVSITGTDAEAVIRKVKAASISFGLGSHDIRATYSYGLVGIRDVRFNAAVSKTLAQSVINRAPVLGNFAFSVVEDTSRAGTLLAPDADGHSVTYSVVTQPKKGKLTLTGASGAYIYTANGNGAKTDSFVVRATDAYGATDNATVTVTITGRSLNGNSGPNRLIGGDAIDRLDGKGGNDFLDGRLGADLMIGGKGDDIYIVDNSGDKVVEKKGEGYDVVRAAASFTLPAHVDALILTGTRAINGTGNADANILSGNAAANRLKGLAGNDVIEGRGGNDILDGGSGRDQVSYAGSRKAVTVNLATARASGGDAAGDRISGFEDILGSAKADRLTGNKSANRLTGAKGADRISGGKGKDRFIYLAIADSPPRTPDVIADFSAVDADQIDLSRIDANTKTTGRNDDFTYIKARKFTRKPGELRFLAGRLEGDVNGDGKADIVIRLTGIKTLPTSRILK